MILPSSTYRVQFRQGMDFARAAELVPHFVRLGVSHVYASPLMTAAKGSTHGYDVTDFNEIDPCLGGSDGFQDFCSVLRRYNLQILLDIVPNHMAASLENVWWRDVLAQGEKSAYSGYFDIDWSRRLTLPILEQDFSQEVGTGAFSLATDGNEASIRYRDVCYPLTLSGATSSLLQSTQLDTLSQSNDFMRSLHASQPWEMIPWKEAAHRLSYRRFFEVSELVGLRMDKREVLDHVHRLVLELVASGQVSGLRIDHIDGLVDPAGYLDWLRDAVGPDVFIVVEKILVEGERLPAWPVQGTTGYEFIAASSAVFLPPCGPCELDEAYRKIAPQNSDIDTERRAAQWQMVRKHFVGEVTRLVKIAEPGTGQAPAFRQALEELLIAFPRYRTYFTQNTRTQEDDAVLAQAIAVASDHVRDASSLSEVSHLLSASGGSETSMAFLNRFQQLSGPIVAKAVEDTLLYRYTRCLAVNEVGCEAHIAHGGVEEFHRRMRDRLALQPAGLTATSTHDTKWSEDARARLFTIGEDVEAWSLQFDRWVTSTTRFQTPLVALNVQWMIFQALLAVLPVDLSPDAINGLQKRFTAYLIKAAREAKVATSWESVNVAYEAQLSDYASALLATDNATFLREFHGFCEPFMLAGLVNSLSVTLMKLTVPGIPDFYQGSEYLQYALVDPDNRYPLETGYPHTGKNPSVPATAKFQLIAKGLRLRCIWPALFAEGDYLPLIPVGERKDHVLAFARWNPDHHVIAIASVRMLNNVEPVTLTAGKDFWGDTSVLLPKRFHPESIDLLTDRLFASHTLRIGSLLSNGPVALLTSSKKT
ncbi:malto-oligosyltrehalose synthase [Ensifer sp. NM-2]|uniref:malto-oligosyltrehalose synthase n=1 Tax=Ensifer sp. NM-2 TaxID=2109730 RepID=UPI000D13CE50|nr:malto-oligosyltrehalose synthase [Ensifer sp. NM-2]PSS64393.1 malto-oligosyltrehalose synthase [Ensifer sp. NM-2]